MDEYRTNRHWKREQDNYLTQIGAMEKIKQDPMASLGYKVRSDPEMLTLKMGSNTDPAERMGLYSFRSPDLYTDEMRHDGDMEVSVELPPQRYAKTTVHELGHVGSRNSQTDMEYIHQAEAGEEEKRQRFADYLMYPPGHPGHEDALWHLQNTYKLKDYDAQAKAYGKKVGLIKEADASPKPKAKPKVATAARKKKKKTLMDYFR